MSSTEEVYGSLLFFRKNGQPSTTCQLTNRKTTIGSSKDADIRFINNKCLEEIHCIIEVNDVGIATLFNKSVSEPVKINNICIRKNKILKVGDEVELAGKKFVFLNENSSKEDSDKQKNAKKIRSTPSKKRYSSALIDLKSEKKSPTLKTKIPIQMRPSTRRYASTSSDFTVTYEKPDKGKVLERSKSTSKVIVSKAIGSPGNSKKRRLSFGDQPKKIDRNPKMSTRNILLSKNIISTITEEENFTSPKLPASMAKLEKSDIQNVEWSQRLYSSELSSEDLIELNLSSGSSLSPMSSPKSDISTSPKKSLSRKSLAKRRLTEGRISKSPRNSLLRHCLQKNQDKSLTKSRESLRKSKTGEFSKQFSSDQSLTSDKPSRHSSRKSEMMEKREEKQLEERYLSGESEGEYDILPSVGKNKIDEQHETHPSSEGLFVLLESRTSNTYSRKPRQSLNKSKDVDPPNSTKSLRKSKTEEQFSSKESPNPSKFSRHSSRKSETIAKGEKEQLEKVSEKSEGESDTVFSEGNRKTNEQYETQSSSEELFVLLESRSPNTYSRKSRQSLNMSKDVDSPNLRESLRKSKTGEQFSSKKSPNPNKSSKHSSKKSTAIEKREEEQPEEQFLSEESEGEYDTLPSVRKSKIDQQYEKQSSSEELFVLPESHTPNIYSRQSRQSLNMSKDVDSPNSRESLRKSKIGEQFSSKESPNPNKSSRHSSRKSTTIEKGEEEQPEEQFLSEESEGEDDILLSVRKSKIDQQYEKQSSSEELFVLPESHTPNIYSRQSRQSLNMSKNVDSPNSREPLRKSKTGEQFSSKESPNPNKSSRHSSRKSTTIEKGEEEQPEEQFLSEESEGEDDILLSVRKSKIDQQYEKQSSSEELFVLPESHTPNIYSRQSRQSLNMSKNVDSPNSRESLRKSKTGEQFSSKESPNPNKSSRHSSRKRSTIGKGEEEQLEEQFLSEESEGEPDILLSVSNRKIDEQYQIQSSSEELFVLPESHTPNMYSRKSRQSLNKSEGVDSPNSRESSRKSKTGVQSSSKESPALNKSSRHSLRNSKTIEKKEEEVFEEQFLSEESEGEPDTLLSVSNRNMEEQYQTQSSSEELLVLPESHTSNTYSRKSRQSLNKRIGVDSPNSRESLRKSKTGEQLSSKEPSALNKSSRHSLRRSKTIEKKEKELLEEQFVSEESEEESEPLHSVRISKMNKKIDEQYETQLSSEELFVLPESHTPNTDSKKSRQSLNKSKRIDSPNSRESLRKSKTGDQLSIKESPAPNKLSRHSLRKSKTAEKNEEALLEEQFLSEESEGESDTLLVSNSKMGKKIDEQYETQSSSEELFVLSESHTPNTYSRKSRQSLNKSKTVEFPNESATRSAIRKTIENGKGQQNKELLDTSGTLTNITKSRQSLKMANTVEERNEQNEKSTVLDVFKSPSPNKSSFRAKQSLMRRSGGKQEKHNESLRESENIPEINALVTPNQRTSLKSKSVADKDVNHQDPSRRLSINLTELQTPNSEKGKERRFSVRKSLGADGKEAGESLFNTSVRTREKETPKERRSSVRQSNRSSRKEEILEPQSSEEPVANVSTMSTPKDTSVQRRSTASKNMSTSVRKTNEPSEDEELTSGDDSLLLNVSSLSTKGTVVQKPATPRGMRESLVRKSNKFNEGKEIQELSSSEEFFDFNVSRMKESSTRLTTTPRETSRTLKMRESPVRRSNKLNEEEQVREQSLTEESFDLNISESNSPREISKQRPSTTPKEIRTSLRKSRVSSIRYSNKFNQEEIGELPPSKTSIGSNNSSCNIPKEKSVQGRATATPKESRSSLRQSNRLDQDEEVGEESSSEESFVLNISAGNSPEEVSIQKFPATPKETVILVKPSPKERGSSLVRKSNRLDTKEENAEISSLAPIRTSTARISSARKSNKLNRDIDTREVSSSEVFLDPNISSKELSAQRRSTMTPKQTLSLVRTPKERSSVRKNKSVRDEEIVTLSSSEELMVPNISAMNTPKETSVHTHLATPNESRSSVRKSQRLSQKEIDELSSNEESLDLSVSSVNTPKEKSIRGRSTTSKGETGSSVRKSTKLNRDEKIVEVSSGDDSLTSSMNDSVEEITEKQPSSESRYSNRDSSIFYVSNSKISTPIPSSYGNNITNETFELSIHSSQDESEFSEEFPRDRITPKLRHSSVKKNHLNTKEEASEMEASSNESRTSLTRSKNISARKSDRAPLTRSKQHISVITLNDSVELTPENNTSVIIINASPEKIQKSKRLSKTLNSTLQDDVELTTPKSAIKSRRSKSLPYNPLVEEITPVTPLSKSKNESGFKTPLNTPGLFEDIKKSVLRSRSQMQKSSTNLMEALNKSEPKRGVKRPLVEESYMESSKRRKIMGTRTSDTSDTSHEADSRSFESFSTEDVLTDISEPNITQNTPKHFSDLTDKPVITHPQMRSSTEPKERKSKPLRKSLNSLQLSSRGSTDSSARDGIIEPPTSSSEQDDSVFVFEASTSDLSSRRSSRRSSLRSQTTEKSDLPKRVQQKTPKNDLSDVAGLKKLLKTPREIKSPKNDLTNVPNLRRLMSPKANNSPRNDLTNIIGVKKLLATPKQIKSPRNDLRKIPNLRKLISPKQQNSPKNDLSDVAGVKKLLRTPTEIKSPKNDLRNVPNLRRLMSTPEYQKSPKNDLTNVPNLRRIMSPKQQNTPRNDLTDVHGLREMMATPRERKELQNELRDVEADDNVFNISGVQRLSIESDIENNEDLFDKLFAKKPLRTYRGKSLSPASRKAMMFDDKRKTLGDLPYSSPRVEKWIEEQAVIKLKKIDDAHMDGAIEKTRTPVKDTIIDSQQESGKRRVRGRRMEQKAIEETSLEESTAHKDNEVTLNRAVTLTDAVVSESKEDSLNKPVRNRNVSLFVAEENKVVNKRKIHQIDGEPDVKLVKKITRSRRKADEYVDKEHVQEHVEQNSSARQITMVVGTIGGEQSNDVSNANGSETDQVNSTTEELQFKLPQVKRGRAKKISQKDEIDQIPEVHSTTEDIKSPAPKQVRGKRVGEIEDENVEVVVVSSPRRGGRLRNTAQVDKLDHIEPRDEKQPQPKRLRGKRKSPVRKDDESGTESDAKPVETEEAHATRGRGRKIKVVGEEAQTVNEPPKRLRGRRKSAVSTDNESGTESDVKKPAEAEEAHFTRGIGRKTKVEKKEEIINDLPQPKRLRGKKKSPVRKDNKSGAEADVKSVGEEARPARGRQLEKVTNKFEESEKGESQTMEVGDGEITSAKPTRGKKRSEKTTNKLTESEEGTEIKKPSRSKKKPAEDETKDVKDEKAIVRPTKVVSEEEQTENETDNTPVITKRTRGRKQNLAASESNSGITASAEIAQVVHQRETEVEISKIEKVSNTGTRRVGRNTKKVAEKEAESEDKKMTEPVKSTRARKQPALVKVETHEDKEGENQITEIVKNTRKKAEETSHVEDDVEMVSSKLTRGRKRPGKATNKLEDSEKGESESTEVDDTEVAVAKPARGKKRFKKMTSKVEDSEEEESKLIEVDDVEVVSSKLTRGRKQLGKATNKLIKDSEKEESGPTEVDDTEIVSAKPTRGKKRPGKTTNKVEGKEEVESKPIEVDDAEMVSSKPTRGRKQLEKVTNKFEESEKGESQSIEVGDREIASAKLTRGRKRSEKTTNKLTESEEGTEVKKASRSKKKPAEDETKDVEDEKAIVGPTKGRKLKAVDKAKLVEDPVPVDSPRTARAKKGNFNKYGSDFLTEQGKKGEKKRVRFEEEEEGSNNKREGKHVAKVEEVEGTVRKSKRARK